MRVLCLCVCAPQPAWAEGICRRWAAIESLWADGPTVDTVAAVRPSELSLGPGLRPGPGQRGPRFARWDLRCGWEGAPVDIYLYKQNLLILIKIRFTCRVDFTSMVQPRLPRV